MARPQSAAEAWDALLAGNRNFMADTPSHPIQTSSLRHDIANEQHSFAAVLCCSDSRLGAEMIFDVELVEGHSKQQVKHLQDLVFKLLPTIEKGRAQGDTTADQFSDRHVVQNLTELLESSEIIANSVSTGKLALVVANYRLEQGQVALLAKEGSL
ncbi:MAG TPA: hypothetical protein VIB80_01165 [Aquiluna sp.]